MRTRTRWLLVLALVATALLSVTATAQARATVTRATLSSFMVDNEGNFFPTTCRVTQVVNKRQRKETFHCTFDAAAPSETGVFGPDAASWASDFDGAPARNFQFVITPSGRVNGWAVY